MLISSPSSCAAGVFRQKSRRTASNAGTTHPLNSLINKVKDVFFDGKSSREPKGSHIDLRTEMEENHARLEMSGIMKCPFTWVPRQCANLLIKLTDQARIAVPVAKKETVKQLFTRPNRNLFRRESISQVSDLLRSAAPCQASVFHSEYTAYI